MTYNIRIVYPGDCQHIFQAESNQTPLDFLETVFAWFNSGSGQECDYFLGHGMRSLSPHDFVCLNGKWYQCASVGWQQVDTEYVQNICDKVSNRNSYDSPWSALNKIMWNIYWATH